MKNSHRKQHDWTEKTMQNQKIEIGIERKIGRRIKPICKRSNQLACRPK